MLHKHNPIQFPSPTCSICCSADEDDTHFLFLCPLKLQVWSQILSLYVNSMTSYVPNDLIHILQSLLHIKPVTDFRDPSFPFPSLSTVQIFACTLQSIWQAHWRTVYHDTPFVPSTVISSTTRFLARLDSEQQLD
jgi:hypothetical protein